MTDLQTSIPAEAIASPRVVYGNGVDPDLFVDPAVAGETMEQLGIPPAAISDTTIYIGGKFNVVRKGLQLLKTHDRFIHGDLERNEGSGSVVRVNSKLRCRPRSAETMNETLVHELEHVAQTERKDPNVKLGNLAIMGMSAAGLILGGVISKKIGNRSARLAGALAAGVAGHDIGYKVAPHEIQARARASQVRSTAIRYRTT